MASISKLSNVTQALSHTPARRFNSTLPISIEVQKALYLNKYKLLLGNKEFTTRSQKKLKEGKRYWGNFGENKDGIIAISNLLEKPSFFQDQKFYLDIDLTEFLDELSSLENPYEKYKQWILNQLAQVNSKESFFLLSSMLLALQKGIFHLPLKLYGRGALVQFKFSEENLFFYCAIDNLGPLQGIININEEIFIELYFMKSAQFLSHILEKFDIVANISLSNNVDLLFDADAAILDLKG